MNRTEKEILEEAIAYWDHELFTATDKYGEYSKHTYFARGVFSGLNLALEIIENPEKFPHKRV